MKTVHRSALLWHSPDDMFALVNDVARYPEFLPWCARATEVVLGDALTEVTMDIDFHGLHHTFTTRNRLQPGRQLALTLVDGPFSHLDGLWLFTPLGDASQHACKVELTLSYGFAHSSLDALAGSAFDRIAANMVDAFVKRAEQVHGQTGSTR